MKTGYAIIISALLVIGYQAYHDSAEQQKAKALYTQSLDDAIGYAKGLENFCGNNAVLKNDPAQCLYYQNQIKELARYQYELKLKGAE